MAETVNRPVYGAASECEISVRVGSCQTKSQRDIRQDNGECSKESQHLTDNRYREGPESGQQAVLPHGGDHQSRLDYGARTAT